MALSDPEKVALGDGRPKTMPELEGTTDTSSRDGDAQVASGDGEDILALQDLDPVLNMKMHLVNNVSNSPLAGAELRETRDWEGDSLHAYINPLNI